MSRRHIIGSLTAFSVAAAASGAVAWMAAGYVEETSRQAVEGQLAAAGLDWAEVQTDGLLLVLAGFAPSEPARFRAITQAGQVVDPGRIVDAMDVIEEDRSLTPRFSLELLRNDSGVSVIGLVPSAGGPELLTSLMSPLISGGVPVTNMVESVDQPIPETWEPALRFALEVLEDLPRSKVSVEPGRVSVNAVADTAEERVRLETRLTRARPRDVVLELDIAAPRPVVAPFTLRFVMPADRGPRFEACAVDSEAARRQILTAAASVGFEGKADCVLALGTPSPSWGRAIASGIEALGEIGGGTLTVSDADVALRGGDDVDPAVFERVAAELERALPDIFGLTAVLDQPDQIDGTGDGETATPEFVATRAPEGQVQLRGRLYDEAQEMAVLSYGRALFGVGQTYLATREDRSLPEGWPVRVLAGLDALARLEYGSLVVQPALLEIRGVTGNSQAEAEISRVLTQKLGADAVLRIDVTYEEELDPTLNIPTPEECEASLNQILIDKKLTFPPGEAVIDVTGDTQLTALSDRLDACSRSVFEIGGHTDSQGREVMNETLSQERAEAVRAALIERGVPPSQLVAVGYGETQPIADNGTEEGREANRRITFTVLGRRDRTADAIVESAPETDAGAETPDPEAIAEPGPAPEAEETQ
ncbi:MAG: OmpA family protein [Pseudomonadota bacterium]